MRITHGCLRDLSSKISVWNGPTCALLPILTTVSNQKIIFGCTRSSFTFWGHSLCHLCRDNSCARRTVDHSVEIWSISLSLITLMTRARVQVPMTIGTRLPKLDPSGTTKNTTSSSYPATSLTWSLAITNPSGHVHQPPSPTKCNG